MHRIPARAILIASAAFALAAAGEDVRERRVFKGPFDMHTSRGATFTFECDNAAKVLRRFVYFKSGSGMYMVPFSVEGSGRTTVTVDRNACIREEGKVEGWDKVTSAMVSFWHEDTSPVKWRASDFKLRRDPYDVVVCTPEKCVHDYPKRLERCGLSPLLVSAAELDDRVLEGARLLVPIGGKKYPASADEAIARFRARGGKILTFGERIKATTHAKLLALMESLLPEMAATFSKSHAEAEERTKLAAAAAAEFPAFMRAGGDDEVRAMSCHIAYGPEFIEHPSEWEDWDANCRRLKAIGFNAVCVNVARGGIAFYNSKVLPMSPEVAKKGDAVDLIGKACAKHGMKFIAWKVCFRSRSGMKTPEFEKWMAEGRGAVSSDGKRSDDWLCPVRPDNRALEIEALVELAKRQPWAISLDYIRYHGNDWCFCDCCHEAFEKFIGRKVGDWPKAVGKDAALKAKWEEFRRGSITALVREVARRVRSEAPGVKVRADVFRRVNGNAITVAQEWPKWCGESLLDIVAPMDGSHSNENIGDIMAEQIAAAGKVPVMPTLYPSLWSHDKSARYLMECISIGRKAGVKGFNVFRFDGRIIEMLGIKKD